ncbi:MAG TPA: LysR family transcriptional regulator [Stellaceae bacterium]|nr:LysR family transcriptional regulator [Stellaceae bacterium]
MDRLASITAFVQVAESGGFTAAARRLHLSTTTISGQVQALEESLGVRLLNRTTRRVSLTEIGREYYERCNQILHELAEADQIAGALQLTPRGQLRVFGQAGIGRYIAQVIADFLARYPDISVDLRTGDAMIDIVEEGFDLAIMPISPPDTSLVRRRLAGWHYTLCCSPGYLQKYPVPRTPADLSHHNCLLYTYSVFGREWPFVDAAGNRLSTPVSGNIVTNSLDTMRAVVLAGLGLWLVPPYIVADLLASGALVRLMLDYASPELEIVALYPHRRYMTAKLRIFLDILSDHFAEEHRWLDAASKN